MVPFRGLKGTIRTVDTIPGLEAGEAFCFYLVELEGTHIKEPIWFECDEVQLVDCPSSDDESGPWQGSAYDADTHSNSGICPTSVLTNAGSCPSRQRDLRLLPAAAGQPRTKGTAQLPCGSGETQGEEVMPLRCSPIK